MKRPAFTLIELIVTVIIVALLCDVFMRGGGIAVLCLGWIPRTVWLLYRLLVHTPLVIPAAIVGFFVAATMLHFPIRLFRKDWKYRQSVAVTGLVTGIFVTMVGLSAAFDLGNELYRPNQAIRKSVDYQRWLRRSGETMKRWAARCSIRVAGRTNGSFTASREPGWSVRVNSSRTCFSAGFFFRCAFCRWRNITFRPSSPGPWRR